MMQPFTHGHSVEIHSLNEELQHPSNKVEQDHLDLLKVLCMFIYCLHIYSAYMCYRTDKLYC